MSIRRATLRQLEIFDTLAVHMSITRTADALHLSPPAVSIQVRQLAEAAGQPLIEQVGKKLYLTDAGNAVALTCRDLFERMERLTQELAALQGLEKGSLRLAIITTAKYFVPRLLGEFSEQHPDIDVSLFVGNRKAILERLSHNQDDLYILGQPPKNLKLTATPFALNQLVAVAYPGHPLVSQSAIPPARLGNESFISRELGSGTRRAYEDFFRQHKTELRIRMELGSDEAIKQTVAGRLGITILAKSTVQAELVRGDLVLLDIQGLPLERQWYVVYPEQKFLAPVTKAFQAFLISQHGDSTTP